MPGNRVPLEICGARYVISTDDPKEYIEGLAEKLDADMNQLMIDTPNASVAAAAVITALGYLDEAEKAAFAADNMRAQLQDYLEDASRARIATEEARREMERLRRELSFYTEKKAVTEAASRQAPPRAQAPVRAPVAPKVQPPAEAEPAMAPVSAPPPEAPHGEAAPAGPAAQQPQQPPVQTSFTPPVPEER